MKKVYNPPTQGESTMKTYCIDWFEQELCECEGSEGYLVRAEDHERVVEELQSRLESLGQEMQEQARIIGMGAERELALVAKVESLEKDAARYRWLRQSHWDCFEENWLSMNGVYDYDGCVERGLDLAIDGHMQANKGE